MFPDRVGRLVLDGVVDADYYVAPIVSLTGHHNPLLFLPDPDP